MNFEEEIKKCSAVADMGEPLATTDMDRKSEGQFLFAGGELDPSLTQCDLSRGLPP